MGEVRTEITLVNIGDQNDARRGYMPQDQVRRLTVNAVVDTGARTGTAGPLVINEETREKLGLRVEEAAETWRKPLAFASEFATQTPGNGRGTVPGGITEYVEVRRKDRETACEAVVLPGEEDVLLGAYPLEGIDLMVNPKKQEVVGAHGDKIRNVVK
jgi:hypothetical protein